MNYFWFQVVILASLLAFIPAVIADERRPKLVLAKAADLGFGLYQLCTLGTLLLAFRRESFG